MNYRLLKLGVLTAFIAAACSPAASPAPTAAPKAAEKPPTVAAVPAAPATAAPAATAPAAPASAPAAAAPSKPANVKTTSAAMINNMNVVPAFVALEKGFWLNHGADVKLKIFPTGNEMAKALQAKEADFTVNALSNFLPAIEQDLPMIGLLNSTGDSTNKFADNHLTITAREGSGIKTVQDLSGKKVAFNGAGTTDEYIKAVLSKANIPVDQVQLINIQPGNTANALRTAQVDAAVLQEPHGTLVLDTVPNLQLVQRGGGYLSYFAFLVTRPDVIDADPDLVQRFVDGWVEAAQWTRQNPEEAARISTVWVPGLDAPVAAKAIKHIAFDPRMSRITMEALEDHRKLLVEQKKMKGTVETSKALNLSFLNKTLETNQRYFSDLPPTESVR